MSNQATCVHTHGHSQGLGGPGIILRREPAPPKPQVAHLHGLEVLQHDISDSLVISSDVGIWTAFPGSKGKGDGTQSISSAHSTAERPGPRSQNGSLYVFLSSHLFVLLPSLGVSECWRCKETLKLPPSFCKELHCFLKETGKNHFLIVLIWSQFTLFFPSTPGWF